MKPVGVIGGGFAGLATGVFLAESGVPVTLMEGRRVLGGRARSFVDKKSGTLLDNGQHAFLGCYRQTLDFLDRIGAAGRLMRQPNLRVDLIHPLRGAGAIACAPLPGPLHALVGLLRYRLLTAGERLRAVVAARRILALHRDSPAELRRRNVEELLLSLGQSENARACLWQPIVVAALNEIPSRCSALPFATVLALAFFGSRADSRFILPAVGLSELYTADARHFIEARGGRVACEAPVAALELDGTWITALHLRDGRRIEVAACVSAVPPEALRALLPDSIRRNSSLRGLESLCPSPIVSVHLWLDRPVLQGDFVGFVGKTTQWIFNRDRLIGGKECRQGQCLSAVISAAHGVVGWERDRIACRVQEDVRDMLPAASGAKVERCVVLKERRATTAPTPGAESHRPGPVTPIENLFLAGDWTNTGLPATVESAVAGGRRAAVLVARFLRRAMASATPTRRMDAAFALPNYRVSEVSRRVGRRISARPAP